MIEWKFIDVNDVDWMTKVGKEMFADSEWKEGEYDEEKIKKYLQEINDKENPKDLHSALDGYY